MCVFGFFYCFICNISHCTKNWARYDPTCTHTGLRVQYRYCCQSLMKLEIWRHIFGKILKYKISWKSVPWGVSCCVRTDRQTDMTKLIVVFFFAILRKPVKRKSILVFPWHCFGKVCLFKYMSSVFICESAAEIAGLRFHSHKVETNAATTPECMLDWHRATVLQYLWY